MVVRPHRQIRPSWHHLTLPCGAAKSAHPRPAETTHVSATKTTDMAATHVTTAAHMATTAMAASTVTTATMRLARPAPRIAREIVRNAPKVLMFPVMTPSDPISSCNTNAGIIHPVDCRHCEQGGTLVSGPNFPLPTCSIQ